MTMTLQERATAAARAEQQGRLADAAALLTAAAAEERAAGRPLPAVLAFRLGHLLHRLERHDEAERVLRQGLVAHPPSVAMHNLLGIVLRRLGRYGEALVAFDRVLRLDPASTPALVNKGNIHQDAGEPARALAVFAELARREPGSGDFQRQIGLAHLLLGQYEEGVAALRRATALSPMDPNVWLGFARALQLAGRGEAAVEALAAGLEALPGNARLLDARASMLQDLGRSAEAEALVRACLAADERQAWAHARLGAILDPRESDQAAAHLRRAVALAPREQRYRLELAMLLNYRRSGDEGADIDEAVAQAEAALALGPIATPRTVAIMRLVLLRGGRHDLLDRLGSFTSVGWGWADSTLPHALPLLGQVRTDADRLDLVEQHRAWGRRQGEAARRDPIPAPRPVKGRAKLRLGFMSSDLCHHPIGYFFRPLIDAIDRDRVEIYCYSYNARPRDAWQDHFAAKADAFRLWPGIADRDAARAIAADGLDMLIEMGGTTAMNRLGVMTWRPAPLQASWLCYPHSSGLETIDFQICDPWLKPDRPGLLIEAPLVLPDSWVAIAPAAFVDGTAIDPRPPVARNGVITFGTANNPSKYGAEMLRAWARTVAAVDGARFLFVRPECGAAAFRDSMTRAFVAEGVSPDRIRFEPVRGRHLPYYNEMDISLDTYPQTGNTSTCEALCMGVPVVTLVGPAFFERMSYTTLVNAGLSDLCAFSVDDFVRTAVALAADRARLADLRRSLRADLSGRPLGQPGRFAAAFTDLMARTVAEAIWKAS